jgi:hypothetical protein
VQQELTVLMQMILFSGIQAWKKDLSCSSSIQGRERLTSSQGFVGEAAMFRDGSDDGDPPKGRSGCPPAKLDAGKHTSEGAPQRRNIGINQPATTRAAAATDLPAALPATTAGQSRR